VTFAAAEITGAIGAGVIATLSVPVTGVPAELVAMHESVSCAPLSAVKVIVEAVAGGVRVPLLIVHAYVESDCAATEALWPALPAVTNAGAVMVARDDATRVIDAVPAVAMLPVALTVNDTADPAALVPSWLAPVNSAPVIVHW